MAAAGSPSPVVSAVSPTGQVPGRASQATGAPTGRGVTDPRPAPQQLSALAPHWSPLRRRRAAIGWLGAGAG